jgi:hypothetical protein
MKFTLHTKARPPRPATHGRRFRIRPRVHGLRLLAGRNRESDRRDFYPHPKAGPNHPAVAVRPPGNEGDVPLVARIAKACPNERSCGSGTTGLETAAWTRPVEIEIYHVQRSSGCDGRTMDACFDSLNSTSKNQRRTMNKNLAVCE